MADKIENLQNFYKAVEKEVKTTRLGAVKMWGKDEAVAVFLGDRVIDLKNDTINERDYIKKWFVN